jgi:preprotein translocase subunit SecF
MTSRYDVDWVGLRGAFFGVSGALCVAGLAAILMRGFNYGIDFTGGTVAQISYAQPRGMAQVREDLKKAGYAQAQPQSFAGGKSFAIYMKGGADQDAAKVENLLTKLKAAAPDAPFTVDRKEFVGPTVGRHLKRQAATAIVLALLAIIVYIAFRFDNPLWGASAVLTIAHDMTIIAGIFAAFQIEVDLVVVAAFLTIAGYSINDTIVIFDRMRENLRHRRGAPLREVINVSINEMRSRTIITNGMVLFVVSALFVLGGNVIHDFAFAMLLGSIVGTYSTVAISTQLLYQWSAGGSGRPEPAPVKVKEGGRRR